MNFEESGKEGQAFHENEIFQKASHVVVMGLVYDICVQHNALASLKWKQKSEGAVHILMPCTAQLKPDFLVEADQARMVGAGVNFLTSVVTR